MHFDRSGEIRVGWAERSESHHGTDAPGRGPMLNEA